MKGAPADWVKGAPADWVKDAPESSKDHSICFVTNSCQGEKIAG